jgi:hypothetical protein
MRGEEAIWGENYASRYTYSCFPHSCLNLVTDVDELSVESRYTDWLEESRVSGCLVITNYQLIFVPDSAAQVRPSLSLSHTLAHVSHLKCTLSSL